MRVLALCSLLACSSSSVLPDEVAAPFDQYLDDACQRVIETGQPSGFDTFDSICRKYASPTPTRLRDAIRRGDLVFDAESQEQPDSLTIRYQDGYTQQWKRVEFASPNRNELNAYAGEYYCDNLDAVHRFSVDNRQLFVQFNFGHKKRLVPATADVFVPATGQWDDMRFEFSRDESDDVKSFEVIFERVQYRFERR